MKGQPKPKEDKTPRRRRVSLATCILGGAFLTMASFCGGYLFGFNQASPKYSYDQKVEGDGAQYLVIVNRSGNEVPMVRASSQVLYRPLEEVQKEALNKLEYSSLSDINEEKARQRELRDRILSRE